MKDRHAKDLESDDDDVSMNRVDAQQSIVNETKKGYGHAQLKPSKVVFVVTCVVVMKGLSHVLRV